MPRRALTGLLLATLASGAGVVAAGSPSVAATTFDVLNGTANATPVHILLASDAFINFRTGAIDNSYPLAHAHIDGAPASESAATVGDTGPLGQTLVGTANPMLPPGVPQISQAQYATAHYPPGSTAPATVGSPGGPYASADATETAAHASATLVSAAAPAAPAGASTSSANRASLRAALTAWRAAWLNPREAALYPMPSATATDPDGTDGDTGISSAVLDAANGLVVNGDSRVSTANFGGGMISISNLRVSVNITNSGTPHRTVSVKIGNATVSGVPVVIGPEGVSVQGTAVPGIAARQQANDALNQALVAGGIKISTLDPVITDTGNQETVDAFGVRVQLDQLPTAPGVPGQHVVVLLGEVFADALAVPSEPLLTTDIGDNSGGPVFAAGDTTGSDLAGVLGDTTFSAGGSISAGGRGTTKGGSGARASVTSAVRKKPINLVLLYFLWQIVLIGTLCSLWWRRQELAGARA